MQPLTLKNPLLECGDFDQVVDMIGVFIGGADFTHHPLPQEATERLALSTQCRACLSAWSRALIEALMAMSLENELNRTLNLRAQRSQLNCEYLKDVSAACFVGYMNREEMAEYHTSTCILWEMVKESTSMLRTDPLGFCRLGWKEITADPDKAMSELDDLRPEKHKDKAIRPVLKQVKATLSKAVHQRETNGYAYWGGIIAVTVLVGRSGDIAKTITVLRGWIRAVTGVMERLDAAVSAVGQPARQALLSGPDTPHRGTDRQNTASATAQWRGTRERRLLPRTEALLRYVDKLPQGGAGMSSTKIAAEFNHRRPIADRVTAKDVRDILRNRDLRNRRHDNGIHQKAK